MSIPFPGLSIAECDDFRVTCVIAELKWSDFEIRIDCDSAVRPGRTGRRLVSVLYKPSGRYRSYRAGAGNNWLSAVEEDIKLHCFVAWSRKTA